jgi:hypothetical protein
MDFEDGRFSGASALTRAADDWTAARDRAIIEP